MSHCGDVFPLHSPAVVAIVLLLSLPKVGKGHLLTHLILWPREVALIITEVSKASLLLRKADQQSAVS